MLTLIVGMFLLTVVSAISWSESLGSGLIAYYEMNEGSGNLVDATGTQDDMTAYGTLIYGETGILGDAINGSGSTANRFEDTGFSYIDEDYGTLMVWYKGGDDDTFEFANTNDGAIMGMGLGYSGGGLWARVTESGYSKLISQAWSYDTDWHNFIVTGDDGNITLFFDGVQGSDDTWDGRALEGGNFRIFAGDTNRNADSFLVDEVAYWNRTLTQSEITDLYNGGAGLEYVAGFAAPNFTVIPANVSLIYLTDWDGVTFEAVDESSFTWSVNDTRFAINSTGYLLNVSPMAVNSYLLNISVIDVYGSSNATVYHVEINQSVPAGSISGTSPITNITAASITGSENNVGDSDVSYSLYRNGTSVSNPDNSVRGVGLWVYIYNNTAGTNFTANASLDTFNLVVTLAPCSPTNFPFCDADDCRSLGGGYWSNDDLECKTTYDKDPVLELGFRLIMILAILWSVIIGYFTFMFFDRGGAYGVNPFKVIILAGLSIIVMVYLSSALIKFIMETAF